MHAAAAFSQAPGQRSTFFPCTDGEGHSQGQIMSLWSCTVGKYKKQINWKEVWGKQLLWPNHLMKNFAVEEV